MRGTASITGTGLVLAALFAAGPAALGAEPAGYQLESEMKFSGAVAGWDYLSFDEQNRRLYISRRSLGEFVFAPDTNEVRGPIKDSEGTNGVALAPDLGRGYTTNGDGTSTVFDLKTLATIERVKVAEDNDANIYDPATHR